MSPGILSNICPSGTLETDILEGTKEAKIEGSFKRTRGTFWSKVSLPLLYLYSNLTPNLGNSQTRYLSSSPPLHLRWTHLLFASLLSNRRTSHQVRR